MWQTGAPQFVQQVSRMFTKMVADGKGADVASLFYNGFASMTMSICMYNSNSFVVIVVLRVVINVVRAVLVATVYTLGGDFQFFDIFFCFLLI